LDIQAGQGEFDDRRFVYLLQRVRRRKLHRMRSCGCDDLISWTKSYNEN
jgi:hypothetical protein